MSPIPLHGWPYPGGHSPAELLRRAGVALDTPEALAASLPFSLGDATCGCENELQAGVLGSAEAVDLPRSIVESNYYRNMVKRERSGEMPRRIINELEEWLQANPATSGKTPGCAWTPGGSRPWPARPGKATCWPTKSSPWAPCAPTRGAFPAPAAACACR